MTSELHFYNTQRIKLYIFDETATNVCIILRRRYEKDESLILYFETRFVNANHVQNDATYNSDMKVEKNSYGMTLTI